MQRVDLDRIEFADDYRYLLNGVPYTGIGVEAVDGRAVCEMEFQNGIQQGTTREFHENGRLRREAQYRNNALHGVVREWSDEGLLQLEEEYEFGVCTCRRMESPKGGMDIIYSIDKNSQQYSLLQLLRQSRFAEPPLGVPEARQEVNGQ